MTTDLWDSQKLNDLIEAQRLDLDHEFQQLGNFSELMVQLSSEIQLVPITVSALAEDHVYYFKINETSFAENTWVRYIHSTGNIIAELVYFNGQCSLYVIDDSCAVDVTCELHETNSLLIISRGKIYLSGHLEISKNIHVICRDFHIQDTETIIENDIHHCVTTLQTNELVVRTAHDLLLDKSVIITTEKSYFSGKNILNHGTISADSFTFTGDRFENQGDIDLSDEIVGFSFEFCNRTNAEIRTKNLFSLSTSIFVDEGKTKAGCYHLQASNASWHGELTIQTQTEILADKNLIFSASARVDAQGLFTAKCNHILELNCSLVHTQQNIELFAGENLNFKGYAKFKASQVILCAVESINLSGLLTGDQQSGLLLKARNIAVNDRLFEFAVIQAEATNHLKIASFVLTSIALSFSADQIDIDAGVESQALDIQAKNININELGYVYAKTPSKITGDVFYNNGKVISQSALELNVNFLICNQGEMSVKLLNINTAVFENFRIVCADSMSVNALISMCMGVTYTKHSKSNTILNLDAGLHLIDVSFLVELFTSQNLLESVKLIFRKLLPANIQLLENAQRAFQFLASDFSSIKEQLINFYEELQQFSANKLPLYRLIADIVKSKDSSLIAKNTIQQFSSIQGLASDSLQELKGLRIRFNQENFSKLVNTIDPVHVATTILDVVTPVNSVDTFFQINSGIVLTTHQVTRAWQMHNHAFTAALGSLSFDVKQLMYGGQLFSLAGVRFSGDSFNFEGVAKTYAGAKVHCNEVILGSNSAEPISGWDIDANAVKMAQKQTIEHSVIRSVVCDVAEQADITINHTSVIATTFAQAEDSKLGMSESVLQTKDADLHNATLTGGGIKAFGNLTGKNINGVGVQISAKKTSLCDSQFSAQIHDNDKGHKKNTASIIRAEKIIISGNNNDDLNEKNTPSVVRAEKIVLSGSNKIDHSVVEAEQDLQQTGSLVGAEAVLRAQVIELNDATLTGGAVNAEVNLTGKNVNGSGVQINAKKSDLSDSQFSALVYVDDKGEQKNIPSAIRAEDIVLSGSNKIKNSIVASKGTLTVNGELQTQGSNYSAKNMTLAAKIEGKKLNQFNVEETLTTTKDSTITAEELDIHSHVFEHYGLMKTTKRLGVLCDKMYNWGTLNLNGEARFDVNQLMLNLNTIKGDKIHINAGVFLNTWHLAGYDNLTVNAVASLNMGLMRSSNLQVNALLATNFGLYLPSLPSSFDSVFTPDFAFNVGRTLLSSVSSTAGGAVGGAYSALKFYNAGGGKNVVNGMYQMAKQLKEDPSKVNFSQVIGLAAETKNVITSASTVIKSAVDTAGLYTSSPVKNTEDNSENNVGNKSDITKNLLVEQLSRQQQLKSAFFSMGAAVTGAFIDQIGPKVSTSAVWSVNGMPTDITNSLNQYSPIAANVVKKVSGLTIANTINEEAVWSTNHGIQASNNAISHTYSKENTGRIYNLTFVHKGDRYTNQGDTVSYFAQVNVNHLHQKNGSTHFSSGLVHAGDLTVSGGAMSAARTNVKIDNLLKVGTSSVLSLSSSIVEGKQADIRGSVAASDKTNIKIAEETAVIGGSVKLNDQVTMDAKHLVVELGGMASVDKSVLKVEGKTTIADGIIDLNNLSSMHAEQLVVELGGKMSVGESVLQAGNTQSDGILSAKKSSVVLREYDALKNSETHFDNSAVGIENKMNIAGKLNSAKSIIEAEKAAFENSAALKLNDTMSNAKEVQFSAQAELHGNNALHATTRLDTDSKSKMQGPGVIEFKAPEGSLHGEVTTAGVIVDIERVNDVHALIYGRNNYQYFQPTQFLTVKTPESISFNQTLLRQCDLAVSAANIHVNAELLLAQALTLKTTQGALQFSAGVHAKDNVYLSSATSITNNGATIVSDQSMFLETAQGDLRNIAGVVQSKQYLEARINGGIHNTAVSEKMEWEYGDRKTYRSAQMLGGCGAEDGVGLFLEATGQVVNDASIIQSAGNNIVHAVQGYTAQAHSESYIAESYVEEGWFSGKTKVVKAADVFSSHLNSTNGRNCVISEAGGISAEASSFVAKEGTDLLARDDIKLFGIKTKQKIKTNEYSWWGISESENTEKHESITPTLIYDQRNSTIRSYQGDVSLQNVLALGSGKLTLEGQNVFIKNDLENHAIKNKRFSLSVDAFGFSMVRSAIAGENPIASLLQEDGMVRQLCAFKEATGVADILANAWNTTINAYNTYQTLQRAYTDNNLGGALLQRYGLGTEAGFNPTFNLTFTHQTDRQRYQSVGAGGIARSELSIIAENEVKITGTPISIEQDMQVDAKLFSQNGIVLNSDSSSRTVSASVGITASGQVTSVGASYGQEKSQQKIHHTQQMNVGGKLTVNAKEWKMDHAQTTADSLSGHVENLSLITRQNSTKRNGFSAGVSTSGVTSASVLYENSKSTQENSSLRVTNAQHSDFLVQNQTKLMGAEVVAQDHAALSLGHVISKSLHDKKEFIQVGLSGNPVEIIARKNSLSEHAVKTIPTVTTQVAFQQQKSMLHSAVNSHGVERIIEVDRLIKSLKLDIPTALPAMTRPAPDVVYVEQNDMQLPIENNVENTSDLIVPEVKKLSQEEIQNAIENLDAENFPAIITDTAEKHEPILSVSEKNSDQPILKFDVSIDEFPFDLEEKWLVYKNGRYSVQLSDEKNGRYTTYAKCLQELKKANAERKIITGSAECTMSFIDWQWQNREPQLLWHVNPAENPFSSYGVNLVVSYRLFGMQAGLTANTEDGLNVSAGFNNHARGRLFEFEMNKSHFNAKAAVDLFNIMLISQMEMNATDKLSAGINCEAGVLGPTGNITIASPEIRFLGLVFGASIGGTVGVGIKAALCAAASITAAQIKSRFKIGLFSGVGVQGDASLNLGVDTDLPACVVQRAEALNNIPMHKKFTDDISSELSVATDAFVNNKSQGIRGFFDGISAAWKISVLQEALDDHFDSIVNAATAAEILTPQLK